MISEHRIKEIAEAYYNNIFAFCRSKTDNADDADDITQETFLLLQSKREQLEDENILAWLFSVADRKIMSRYRSERRLRHEMVSVKELAAEEADSLAWLDEAETVSSERIEKEKEKILNCLSAKERELFILLYVRHWNYNRIAQQLNVREGALRVRALRVRKKINEMAELAFFVLSFTLTKALI